MELLLLALLLFGGAPAVGADIGFARELVLAVRARDEGHRLTVQEAPDDEEGDDESEPQNDELLQLLLGDLLALRRGATALGANECLGRDFALAVGTLDERHGITLSGRA